MDRPRKQASLGEYDVIRLQDMVFQAKHGCSIAEREVGATFTVNIELFTQLRHASITDQLEDTIDVADVYKITQKIILGPVKNLVESIAGSVAEALLNEYPQIEAVRIRVHKDRTPLGGPSGGYEIEMLLH